MALVAAQWWQHNPLYRGRLSYGIEVTISTTLRDVCYIDAGFSGFFVKDLT